MNFFIRKLHFEKLIYNNSNPYLKFNTTNEKSTQQNAGYSERPEINEVLEKSKRDLYSAVNASIKANSSVLDVGCGPGMYLSLFKESNYHLFGTDINESMLEVCKKNVPQATYFHGNFMNIEFNRNFDFIYCIGVLIYIPTYDIQGFFKKIHSLLNNNGILYLNYPHAISWLDTVYNDLTYIQYSPEYIESIVTPYFKIIKHEHAFDGRIIKKYDKEPYKSLNPVTDRTYKNSYLLIAKKI